MTQQRPLVPSRRRPAAVRGHLLAPLVDQALLLFDPALALPAEVHDLRVAITRLRVGLAIFRDDIGRKSRRHLDADLHRVMHRLGPVRELDVLRADLDDELLIAAVAQRRRHALHRARRGLGGRHAADLRRRLYRLRRQLQRPAASWARPADRALVMSTLDRRLARLHAWALAASDGGAYEAHRLRLQIKKLRYAVELFMPLYPRAATTPFLASLKKLQDRLGAAHDAVVEARQLAALRGVPDESMQVSPGAHAAPTDPALRRACMQELSKLKPFWLAQRPLRR